MKKLGLMIIAALLCLSGCGNNEKVTKSCKIQENGMSEVMTITSSGKKVTTTESVLTVSYEDNQITTEEDKELLRTMIVGNFGDVKGISV